jgi:hypothetical protein
MPPQQRRSLDDVYGSQSRSLDAIYGGTMPTPTRSLDDVYGAGEDDTTRTWGGRAALGVRGIAGLVPGGPWGAAASGLGEGIGQLIERATGGRDEFNLTQIGAQSALGLIPFAKWFKAGQTAGNIGKGAMLGAGSAGVTSLAEGELPTGETLTGGAAFGGLGAGIGTALQRAVSGRAPAPPPPTVTPPSPRPQSALGDLLGLAGARQDMLPFDGPVGDPRLRDAYLDIQGERAALSGERAAQGSVLEQLQARLDAVTARANRLEGGQGPENLAGATQGMLPGSTGRMPPSLDTSGVQVTPGPLATIPGLEDMFPMPTSAVPRGAGARSLMESMRNDLDRSRPAHTFVGEPEMIPSGGQSRSLEDLIPGLKSVGRASTTRPSLDELDPYVAPAPRTSGTALDDFDPYVEPAPRTAAPTSTRLPGDTTTYNPVTGHPVAPADMLQEWQRRSRHEIGFDEDFPTFLTRRMKEQGDPAHMPWQERQAFQNNDARYRDRLADDRGSISPEMLVNLGSAGVGAAAGAAMNDDPLTGAVGGGALGALLPLLIRDPQMAERLRYFSLLSGPATHAKNVIGGGSAATFKALEDLVSGNPQRAGSIMSNVFSPDTITRAKTEFNHPSNVNSRWGQLHGGVTGIPSRAMAASDEAIQGGLRKAGVPAEEARITTLTNDPRSNLGRSLQQFQQSHPAVRFAMPFVRTATNLVERGLERTPGVGYLPQVRRMSPGGADLKTATARQGLGMLAAALGTQIDTDNPYLVAALGPYMLPTMLGSAGAEGFERGDDPSALVKRVIGEGFSQTPIPESYEYSDPGRLLAQFVPNLLRPFGGGSPSDYEMETLLDPAIAKIPGLNDLVLQQKRKRAVKKTTPRKRKD